MMKVRGTSRYYFSVEFQALVPKCQGERIIFSDLSTLLLDNITKRQGHSESESYFILVREQTVKQAGLSVYVHLL